MGHYIVNFYLDFKKSLLSISQEDVMPLAILPILRQQQHKV